MDPVKILALKSSPRKSGNTAILADLVLRSARLRGATTESVQLVDLDLAPCRQCETCHRAGAEGCVLGDDFNPLAAKMREADILVVAVPIWWSGVHASLKLVMDRCYSLVSARWDDFKLAGKGIVLIASQAQRDLDLYARPLAREFKVYEEALGFRMIDSILVSAGEEGDILGDEEAVRRAETLGVALVSWNGGRPEQPEGPTPGEPTASNQRRGDES